MKELREKFPLLCFKEGSLSHPHPDSTIVNCTICDQKVYKAPTMVMAVVDDETNAVEKVERGMTQTADMIPVCTDCARDLWASMNMLRKDPPSSKAKKLYNQT